MSDTPRTDAAICRNDDGQAVIDLCSNGFVVPAHVARELERENARLREDAQTFRNLRSLIRWPTVTEVYISPLIAFGAQSRWQVELNFGDRTEAFSGDTLPAAIDAAMQSTPQPAG